MALCGGSIVWGGFVHFSPAQDETSQIAVLTPLMGMLLPKPQFEYIEVVVGCGPHFAGSCVAVRSGPGTQYRVVAALRRGIVLKTAGKTLVGGHLWYRISFDEGLLYPERVRGGWYVEADYVRPFLSDGVHEFEPGITATTSKHIVINRSSQILYAYDGDRLFMQQAVSTGLDSTPTPRGTFVIYKKNTDALYAGTIAWCELTILRSPRRAVGSLLHRARRCYPWSILAQRIWTRVFTRLRKPSTRQSPRAVRLGRRGDQCGSERLNKIKGPDMYSCPALSLCENFLEKFTYLSKSFAAMTDAIFFFDSHFGPRLRVSIGNEERTVGHFGLY